MPVTPPFSAQKREDDYIIRLAGPTSNPALFYTLHPHGEELKPLCILTAEETCIPSPAPEHRIYFVLQPEDGPRQWAASRAVEINGVENIRDLGGYPVIGGKQVKWGRFFRSGILINMSDRDKTVLNAMRLQRIFDYRSQMEAAQVPDNCPDGAQYVWISAMPKDQTFLQFADRNLLGHLKNVHTTEDAAQVYDIFLSFYAALPFENEAYRQMLHAMDDRQSVPFLQHCAAGKDRTGVGCALLLLALGADEETAMQDYLLSAFYREDSNRRFIARLVEAGISPAAEGLIQQMMDVVPDMLSAALGAIKTKYPSYEAFFLEEYGITQERLAHWRQIHTY